MLTYDPFWIAKAHLELWNNRNPKPFKELLAPAATVRFVWEKEEKPAHKTVEEHVTLWQTAFMDAKFVHTDIIPTEGTLVLEWVCEATHSGKFFEIPPTGRHGKVRGTSVLKINEDGKIVRETIYVNLAAVLDQFGLLPVPPEEVKLRDLTLAAIELINKHDIVALKKLLAPDLLIVRENGQIWTREQFCEYLLKAIVAVPDLKTQATHVVVRGNEVVLEQILTGTHTGPMEEIPATNRPLKMEACTILTFVDEKVAKVRLYLDVYTLLATVGRVPELVIR